ncbi:MAG: hypothetical protein KBS55_01685 [Bacteroidales bacterium]|nr:hypothetical protein [Candidatus Cryptobacteroides aphodequi]
MIIYQALTRLFGDGKFRSFDAQAYESLRALGVSHIWFTGVPRHSAGQPWVKGTLGSPYAISDYYDVNPYLADDQASRLAEFDALVERTHEEGFGVVMDFVPNHVAPDYSDRCGGISTHRYCDWDWTDTRKIDWADPSTPPRMLAILKFWASKGVDAFRVDMAELVGPEVLGKLISGLKTEWPAVKFIGEVYDINSYARFAAAGFDLLYDKSGVYDILRGIREGRRSARELTSHWQMLGPLQDRMLNFLENHDEQRLRSWAPEGYLAGVAYAALFNKASFLLYFGQENGEAAPESNDGRTSIFNDGRHIKAMDPAAADWTARYAALMSLASSSLCTEGSNWDLAYLQGPQSGFDANRHAAFLRYDSTGRAIAVLCNFSGSKAVTRLALPDSIGLCRTEVCLEAAPYDYSITEIK